MSLRTLPILFFNLGGEMLYILDQRLRAQDIRQEKAMKGERKLGSVGLNNLHPSPDVLVQEKSS